MFTEHTTNFPAHAMVMLSIPNGRHPSCNGLVSRAVRSIDADVATVISDSGNLCVSISTKLTDTDMLPGSILELIAKVYAMGGTHEVVTSFGADCNDYYGF